MISNTTSYCNCKGSLERAQLLGESGAAKLPSQKLVHSKHPVPLMSQASLTHVVFYSEGTLCCEKVGGATYKSEL